MISFSNINKQYGKQLIFVDTSFQLNPGEKVGLVGPNGAGKSTAMRALAGLLRPVAGDILLDDQRIERIEARHDRRADRSGSRICGRARNGGRRR